MTVEYAAALGIDIEDVDGAGSLRKLGFNATEKLLENGRFERVEEEEEGGGAGEVEGEGVLLQKAN